jgi:ribosomal protein S12 methylthiotransferase
VVQLGGGPPLPAPSHLVFDHTAPRLLTTQGHAYLKVAEGCNNPCTFCAIPIWRGKFRSRTIESLVEEAKQLEAAGITELNLIAQDTTRYGEDLGIRRHGLVRLVEALLAATSIPWIRFLYAYPTTLDEDLLRLMGTEERFCSYLDMPLQHSHGDVLTAMRRGGDAKRYLRLLERARELAPDVFLRSTFIVGFPGETEEHFRDLMAFVEQARFDHLGAFAYSPEEGTPGAELPDRVPRHTQRRRLRQLLEAQKPIALAQRQRLVGRRMNVLVEGICEESEHLLQGRHHGMAPQIDGRVLINDGAAPAGTLVEVEITEAFADDLVGHIVGSSRPQDADRVIPAEAAYA